MINQAGIRWTDYSLETSVNNVLKDAEKAEKAALRAGGNLLKNNIKKEVQTSIKNSTRRNSTYPKGHKVSFIDRLIDAVRITKPHDGYIKFHILGTKKKGSGTYRLRFFESAKERFQKKVNGKTLKTSRRLGNLGKFNGFFMRGVNASQGQLQPTMEAALEKYIKKAWNG